MMCHIDKSCYDLKDHLIPNIWTPHLIRLTEKCKPSHVAIVMQKSQKEKLHKTPVISVLCRQSDIS